MFFHRLRLPEYQTAIVVTFLIRLLTEHGADFFDRLILSFRHFLPGEPTKEGQECRENDEDVRA